MTRPDTPRFTAKCAKQQTRAANRSPSWLIFADQKIRVGRFPDGGIELVAGAKGAVTVRDVPGEPGLIPSQCSTLAKDLRPDTRVLLADRVMELKIEHIDDTEVRCKVIAGGFLTDRKGINLPDVQVFAPSMTDKDRSDALVTLSLGVDFLALSFVRTRSDLDALRTLVNSHEAVAGLIVKIERPEALEHIDAILEATDDIMVARSDLGVELPPEQVPAI